ncbi:hypothetical protein I350_00618 [Cryptococcus amylolentus CBS 6273]|uniref:GDP/GTP exchange factor Sec2 N-terminal domain-containing protein n=1 Tax=Cryptococcus amylolentus CBS 6273 TaxID=1296118 RepID=A0A1E3KFG3_9TREE|nr:hypothetical protein I350_00618 [Cryptococcus amylolentus CBS 6273]
MHPAGPTAFYGAYGSHPASRSTSPAPNSPGGVVQPPFDFPTVSFPPRLKNIGRQLSQISNDFFSEDEGETMTARREALKKQQAGGTRPQTPVQKGFKIESVPGMGEDPVMCPFCEKPLPPALFLEHTHHSDPKATPKSVKSKEKQQDAPMPKTPKVSSEDLATTVKEGDIANHDFAEGLVSADDLRRWASLAGITLSESAIPKPATTATPKKASPEPVKPAESKAFPLLPPPPPPLQAGSGNPSQKAKPSRQDSGSGRFGFWKSSKKEDEESSDDEGGAVGYQKIGAGDEESDDEEKKVSEVSSKKDKEKAEETVAVKDYVQDEPVEEPEKTDSESEPKVEPVVQVDDASPASHDDLKIVLTEVLAKVGQMSQSQNALLTSHSSLLTSLKIARSNLAMAEANTEMLEAQLARGPTPVVPINQRTVSSPVTSTHPSRPTSAMGDKQRPSNLQLSSLDPTGAPASAPANGSEKSSWFSNNKKKLGNLNLPSAVSLVDSFSSPTTEYTSKGRSSGDYFGGSAVPYGAAMPNERPGVGRTQSHSSVSRSLGGTTTIARPAQSADIIQLRQAYSAAVAQISALTTEVADLKSGKKEMEEELESLSQELFEEANKMVADERKKRAEAEENLKEVREEKDALKETVKVLGGRVDSPAPGVQEEPGENKSLSGSETVEPRDLDKHYAALRKSIHHVSSPPTSPPATQPSFPDVLHQPLPVLPLSKEHATMSIVPEQGRSTATPPIDIPSSRPVSTQIPAESNPWASSLESSEGEDGQPEFKMSLMTPSPQPEEKEKEVE